MLTPPLLHRSYGGSVRGLAPVAIFIALLAAGCGPMPDLIVQASQKLGYQCDNGILRFTVLAVITNNGSAPVTLPSDWTKPWVTGYPSTSISNFVKPYQTGTTITLNTGQSTSVEFPVSIPSSANAAAYDFIVDVDPNNTVKESNENNNSSKIPVPAHICG